MHNPNIEKILINQKDMDLVFDKGKYTNVKITTYHNSNQVRWANFSEEVVKNLATIIKKSPPISLLSLLRLLGNKRNEIAHELKHGTEGGMIDGKYFVTEAFGKLRGIDKNTIPGYHPKELLYYPPNQTYPGKWDKLYESVAKKIQPHLQNESLFKKDTVADYDYGLPVFLYPLDFSDKVFRIEQTVFYPIDITIFYPIIKTEQLAKKMIGDLDIFLQKVLNWHETDIDTENVTLFLKDLGILSWHLYRLMPFYLGTSSIVNWLTRGLAESKGVTLGMQQDNPDDLPLDFEAFVTFNADEYGDWFSKHAFRALSFQSTLALITESELKESPKYKFWSIPTLQDGPERRNIQYLTDFIHTQIEIYNNPPNPGFFSSNTLNVAETSRCEQNLCALVCQGKMLLAFVEIQNQRGFSQKKRITPTTGNFGILLNNLDKELAKFHPLISHLSKPFCYHLQRDFKLVQHYAQKTQRVISASMLCKDSEASFKLIDDFINELKDDSKYTHKNKSFRNDLVESLKEYQFAIAFKSSDDFVYIPSK